MRAVAEVPDEQLIGLAERPGPTEGIEVLRPQFHRRPLGMGVNARPGPVHVSRLPGLNQTLLEERASDGSGAPVIVLAARNDRRRHEGHDEDSQGGPNHGGSTQLKSTSVLKASSQ